MHNDIVVRSMKIDDVDVVSKLLNKLSYNQLSRDNYYKKESKFLLNLKIGDYYKKCFFNPNCFVFVVEYENKLIGFAEMWIRKKDFFFSHEDYAYILNGFVDKEIKTSANPLYIPFKLFQACEDKAIELGYNYIGGDVFDFNVQMKTLLKLYKVKPYRTRYMKRLIKDE